MGKVKEFVKKSYGSAWGACIFCMLFALYVFPLFFKTLVFGVTKISLSKVTLTFAPIGGALLALFFIYIALLFYDINWKNALHRWISIAPTVLCTVYVGDILFLYAYQLLDLLGAILISVACGLLYGTALLSLSKGEEKKKRIGLFIITSVVFAFLRILQPILDSLTQDFIGNHFQSFFAATIGAVITVLCIWLFTTPVLSLYVKEERQILEPKKKKEFYIAGIQVLLAFAVIFYYTPSDLTGKEKAVTDYVLRATAYFEQTLEGYTVLGSNNYNELFKEVELIKKFSDMGGSYTLNEQDVASNPQITYLSLLLYDSIEERVEKMEEYHKKGYNTDTDYYFFMLSQYKKCEELTKEQKNCRNEILYVLAKNKLFYGGLPEKEDYGLEEVTKIEKAVEMYADDMKRVDFLADVMVGSNSYGTGITENVMNQALDMAVENPNDFSINYVALTYYNNCENRSVLWDSLHPNTKIKEVTDRFENLYLETFQKDITEEEKEKVKEFVLYTYLNMLDYEAGATYGLAAMKEYPESRYFAKNTMYALYQLQDYDKVLKIAEDGVKKSKDSQDPLYLYYKAMALMGKDEMSQSLKTAVELAELVLESEYPETADQRLNDYVSSLVVNNELTKEKLSTLTERERGIIASNDLLSSYVELYEKLYVNAYYTTFEQAVETADYMVKTYDDLPYAHYLRGVLHHSQGEYEDAIEEYKKALELLPEEPMMWYALSLTYNSYAINDRENAYICAENAMKLSNWRDYYGDAEGMGIHMFSTMDSTSAWMQMEREQAKEEARQ